MQAVYATPTWEAHFDCLVEVLLLRGASLERCGGGASDSAAQAWRVLTWTRSHHERRLAAWVALQRRHHAAGALAPAVAERLQVRFHICATASRNGRFVRADHHCWGAFGRRMHMHFQARQTVTASADYLDVSAICCPLHACAQELIAKLRTTAAFASCRRSALYGTNLTRPQTTPPGSMP